jgi:hypothetical protein
MSMTAFEKYKRLFAELLAARSCGELLQETEAHFAQALDDCYMAMDEHETREAERMFSEQTDKRASLMKEATAAVGLADDSLQVAITAFERLRDAELALARMEGGPERDIGNSGFARADLTLCVLRALGTE